MLDTVILYSLILVPLTIYAIAFGYETYMSISRLLTQHYTEGAGYVHATWEVTHTLLVYSFVIFMTSHSNMLPKLATVLFLPVSIIAIALMIRAVLYLYLFYGNDTPRAPRFYHFLFALCHIVPFVALIWGGLSVGYAIQQLGMAPMTNHLWIVFAGFIITTGFCVIPLSRLYRSS